MPSPKRAAKRATPEEPFEDDSRAESYMDRVKARRRAPPPIEDAPEVQGQESQSSGGTNPFDTMSQGMKSHRALEDADDMPDDDDMEESMQVDDALTPGRDRQPISLFGDAPAGAQLGEIL
jgi:hypothetical protein